VPPLEHYFRLYLQIRVTTTRGHGKARGLFQDNIPEFIETACRYGKKLRIYR